MGGGNHNTGIELTGNIGKCGSRYYPGILAACAGRKQPGDKGVFHSVPGCAGIPADNDIGITLADSHSHSKSSGEQFFAETGAYAGRAEELHITSILLLSY